MAAATILPFVTSTLLGGKVMSARYCPPPVKLSAIRANRVLSDPRRNRKEMDVPYPNLYATPGYHKRADEFNR